MVEKHQLEKMENILAQSMKGVHVLFDNKTISRLLSTPTDQEDFFNFENVNRIQDLFVGFMKCETIHDKHDYLQSLSPESYEILIRAYFNIVENTLYENSPLKH